MPSRNSKTSGFQKGRAEFRATVNFSKDNNYNVVPPFFEKCAILITPKQ
jgi:hypothetical protein